MTSAQLGNHQAAIEDYNQAIALDAASPLAYIGRGVSELKDGNYDTAQTDFQTAADLFWQRKKIAEYRAMKQFIQQLSQGMIVSEDDF
jgi:Flp pilus assembly protein TadD